MRSDAEDVLRRHRGLSLEIGVPIPLREDWFVPIPDRDHDAGELATFLLVRHPLAYVGDRVAQQIPVQLIHRYDSFSGDQVISVAAGADPSHRAPRSRRD